MHNMHNKTCLDIRQQINLSVKAGVPGYNWIPTLIAKDKLVLQDTVSREVAEHIDAHWKRQKFPIKGYEDYPGQLQPESIPAGKSHGFTEYVHPDSDFCHIDPGLIPQQDIDVIRNKLPNQYNSLKRFIGEEALGMQRLACVFEWVMAKATELLTEINKTLVKKQDPTAEDFCNFNRTRNAYIAFLKDLDDHEPHSKGKRVVTGEPGRSGYGMAMKWAYIFPAIYSNQIYGAKVIVMWNPHSSSDGIPIQHC